MGYLADDSYCAYYVPTEGLQVEALEEEWGGVRRAGAHFATLCFSSPAELDILGDEDSWQQVLNSFIEAILLFVDDQNLVYKHARNGEMVRKLEFSEGRWTRWTGIEEQWEEAAGIRPDRTDIAPQQIGIAIGNHFGFEPCPMD